MRLFFRFGGVISTCDALHGVIGVAHSAFRGGMPIGSLVVGRLIPQFTAPVTIAFSGSVLVVLGLYFLLVQRRVANL